MNLINMRIIFATSNLRKFNFTRAVLVGLPIELVSASDVGVIEKPPEDGHSFAENALQKARYVAAKTKDWTMADDTGVSIDALNGAPGIHSRRWLGKENATPKEILHFTLERLTGIPEVKRQAQYETAIALLAPDGREWTFSGKINGQMATQPRGVLRNNAYEVLFIPDGYDQTLAEMPDKVKNKISHRGLALKKLKQFLEKHEFEP